MKFAFTLILVFYFNFLVGQDSLIIFDINVRNRLTKEIVDGAICKSFDSGKILAQTDLNGVLKLRISTTANLIVSAQGFKDDTLSVTHTDQFPLTIFLDPISKELINILVSSEKRTPVRMEFAGVQQVYAKDLKNIPVIFGERDILKTIQLLPGIKNAGEGTSGLYVRGGSADQNLILLDGATVYNASHMLGFFSIFNSDIIGKISIYKGSLPAEIGGRLSSAIDVNVNRGDLTNFSVSGGIGLIASKLNIEGPIVKDKASFLISARRTYPDAYLKLSKDIAIRNNKLNFDDINAKLFLKLNNKNDLSLTLYQGTDRFSLGKFFTLDYGNKVATILWTRRANHASTAKTSLSYTDYRYQVGLNSSNTDIKNIAYIKDLSLRRDAEKKISEKNTIKFGGHITLHDLKPNAIISQNSSSYNSVEPENRRAVEFNTYFSNELKYQSKFLLNYGVRVNSFSVLGPGNYYVYDNNGILIDALFYKPWNIGVPYINIEPRLAINFNLDKDRSLKFSYTRNSQNTHLLSSITSSSPIDIFLYSNNNIKPETSDQISLGYFQDLFKKDFEFLAEVYYKDLQRQLEFKNGAQVLANDYIEPQIIRGIGRAYGMELTFRKKTGRLNGWISYTLSKTERSFNEINNGKWFNARQDRPHEISIVGLYPINTKWLFSSTWVFYSGNAVTFPNGRYVIADQTAYYYSERNAQRMPNYHRLDLSATRKMKTKANKESSWTFSIYNAYNRDNPYSINFQNDLIDPNKTIAVQTTLFRIVPSLTYNFKF